MSTKEKWNEVNAEHPCPICEKPDYCRRSPNGNLIACRRESRGAHKTKTYKDGSEAYLHRLRDDDDATGNGRAKSELPIRRPAGLNDDKPEIPPADIETWDRAYRLLLTELSLSQEHRQALRERGLSEEQIDASEYRTLPRNNGKVAKKLHETLGADFETVPGFLTNGKIRIAAAGLLVPVRDADRRIVAIKVRSDRPSASCKYFYLSSTKYEGPGPGSPAHVPASVCGPCETVRVTEGELKADVSTGLSGVPTISFPGVSSWRVVLPVLRALGARLIRVAFDADADTNKHVARALLDCVNELQAQGYEVEFEQWPLEAGKGIDDLLAIGGTPEVLCGSMVLQAVQQIATAAGVKPPQEKKEKPKGQATLLVELAAAAELWHTPGYGDAFASIGLAGHVEHWPVRSRAFRRWLARAYFVEYGRAPGGQALQDAINVIEGQAVFAGEEHAVSVRVAECDGKLYLDLADEKWRAVEIDAAGWWIVESCPIRFRRAKAMLSLPIPEAGGDINELRQFVNVMDDDWPLVVAWLVATLRPTGPYPILNLHGEQGSAKSTTARVLRGLLDANAAPIRSEPRDPRDLMIAANNGWIIALDNLSHVPVWLSDALCRLATGGGFSTRTLYENDEETIFDAMRPSMLTGIEEVANRSDLLDRSLIVHLPQIPEGKRRTEREFWREFQKAQGRILGAILDAVSAAIRNLPTTTIAHLPRMADFALWATAAESQLGIDAGGFISAYRGNRETANESALESSPVAKYVLELATPEPIIDTSTNLLAMLESKANDNEKRLKSWPKSPQSLSGTLKRLAPNLRAAGVDVEFGKDGRGRQRRRVITIRRVGESSAPIVPTVPDTEITASTGDTGDASDRNGDEAGTQATPSQSAAQATLGAHGDAGDASISSCSDDDWGEV